MNKKYVLAAICGLTLMAGTCPAFAQMGTTVQRATPAADEPMGTTVPTITPDAAQVQPAPAQYRAHDPSPQDRVGERYEWQENLRENSAARSFYEGTKEPYPNLTPIDQGLESIPPRPGS